ncbi:MAG: ABC transporter permease [Thermodesulfobacteriota bacterium]
MVHGLIYYLGNVTCRCVRQVGGMTLLSLQSIYLSLTPPYQVRPVLYQMDQIGIKSLFIVSITALFTGLVLGLQTMFALPRFGAKSYLGAVVSLSVVREMGPVLTALVVGGRVGSGMAAELGSMAVTEQVDAMRAMGDNPIKRLVVPRMLACVMVLPLLTVVADALGIVGGLVISLMEIERSFYLYFNVVQANLVISDVVSGLAKSVFFGFIIAIVGCYQGLSTRGGTQGVGLSTTLSVVTSFILILVADFFLTKLFLTL